jgi:hypothetical protein
MTPTRIRTLLGTAVAVGVLSWLLLRIAYATLPPVPWTVLPAVLIAAGVEAYLGYGLRGRILRRPGTRPADPMYVTRMAALAKATSLTAAVIGGAAAGFVVTAASSLPARAAGHDVLTAASTFGGTVILALAALYLEYCCRVPDDPGAGRYVPPPRSADHFH